MRRLIEIVALALVVWPAASLAQGSMSLAWDHCAGDGGVTNRNSTCTTNSGPSNWLLGSFRAPYDFPNCVGMEMTVDVLSSEATLPDWWQVWNTGSCRQLGIAVNFAYVTELQNCADAFLGLAVGGIGAYQVGVNGPNSARLRMVQAVAPDFRTTIQAGPEYVAFELQVRNVNTVGANACTGCEVATCLAFTSLRLVANDNTYVDIEPNDPSYYAGFQCGLLVPGHGPGSVTVCIADPNCLTSSRNTSWGQIKSLYR